MKLVLPFGQYLENRGSFLAGVEKSIQQRLSKGTDGSYTSNRAVLEKTGSVVVTDLVTKRFFEDEEIISPHSSVRDTFHLRQMLAAGMHMGHAPRKWHPKMRPFLFGERVGIHIMDLSKSLACLRVASSAVTDIASKGGLICFVGTREPIQRLVYETATDAGQYYVNRRWIGGTLTNRRQVLRNAHLLPDMVVVLDYPNNLHALVEAEKVGIPSVAICDSDCDPTKVTYPIPANDDALSSVELVARTLGLAAKRGRQLAEGKGQRQHDAQIFEQASHFAQETATS